MCWGDTRCTRSKRKTAQSGLVRYASGAIGQFEVSWTFRGGMDLRDEVSGTEGTIWLNHWLRTGYELFTWLVRAGMWPKKPKAIKAGYSRLRR